jgi:excisionase family DNA binding protein
VLVDVGSCAAVTLGALRTADLLSDPRDCQTSGQEVAEILGVAKSTVEDWARRGMVPSRKRGRRRFFLRWEIENWLIEDDRAA